MKKVILFGIFFTFALFSLSGVYAASCDLSVSLINQDPYPAIPGDFVKIVFQINGVDNPECGRVDFELLENYPLVFDPNFKSKVTLNAGIYQKDFSSFLIAPYKVRLDGDALDGDNPIEVRYKFGTNAGYETKQFDLNVEDSRADFEVHIKDYEIDTNILTFEILNIAEQDIEALTIEIPTQEGIIVKGSNINIEGDLDSNDYLTTSFEAVPQKGFITMNITYTDSINKRRVVEKNVFFEPGYFENRIADQKTTGSGTYIFWAALVIFVGYLFYRRWNTKKKKALQDKLRK